MNDCHDLLTLIGTPGPGDHDRLMGRLSPACSLAGLMIAATAMEHGLVLATHQARNVIGCGPRLVNPWRDAR